MNETLAGMRVAVLVTDGFEQIEMTGPLYALELAGASYRLIGEHMGEIQGVNHDQPGDTFMVDATFEDVDAEDFDAALIPGGVKNGHHICTLPAAQHLVQDMDEMGKVIAAICHGPLLLTSAGVLEGRTLTSHPDVRDDIRQAGGNWVYEEVMTDENWITSRNPDDVPAFSQALVGQLEQQALLRRGGQAATTTMHRRK